MNSLKKIANDYSMPSRTKYQLEHFVIGQHDTPEMRYRQIILEAKDLLHKINDVNICLEILKKKIEKLEKSDDEIDQLKAKRKRLAMAVTEDALKGAHKEFQFLVEIAQDYRYYSVDEVEANQAEYWDLRLTRQATTDRIALEQGVNVGNLASMMQAGLVQKQLVQ